jgi:GDP-4-dehydro-6-deoxy-D-mannose reductase
MRSLITGVTGFAGAHLARHLLDRGHTVAGIRYAKDRAQLPEHLPTEVEIHEADILDEPGLTRIVSEFESEAIFHLAAFSNPQSSWENARRTLETNIIGSHNLLQAATNTGILPRVLLVGSGQQYGNVPEKEQPIAEDCPQRPVTPYGVSKSAQEMLGIRFFLAERLPVFLVRSFNHTGPGQEPSYVCSSFARQVAEIEAGRREPPIRVGSLDVRRDFTDVRDVVRGYAQILEDGKPADPYNLCRGEAFSIQEILDTLVGLAGGDIPVEVDSSRYHAADAPLVLGDNTKLRRELGWKPEIELAETLRNLLDYWRKKLN